jgi:hypothetical protein
MSQSGEQAGSYPVGGAGNGAAIEIVAFSLVILSYMWAWQRQFDGAATLVTTLYFGIGIVGHLHRRESFAELGIRFDNAWRALRNALPVIGVAAVLLLGSGALLDSWRFPSSPTRWLGVVAWLLLWGTVQQYGLNCILYRRFHDLFGTHTAAAFGAATLFALFHLPNPLLTAATFIAGLVACTLYRRVPNVFVLGLTHAAISILIHYSLPFEMTRGMRVGPGYYSVLIN